jgi:hypothetical protein
MSELLYSTDELWYGNQTGRPLTGEIDNVYQTLGELDGKYAAKEHKHDEYAAVSMLDTKSDIEHNHDSVYCKKSEVDEKIEALKTELMELIGKTSTDTKSEPAEAEAETNTAAEDNGATSSSAE